LQAIVLIAAALLLLPGLSRLDLWAPDEPRYAEVAEEMRAGEEGLQSLVLLRLNGEPYTQKPPLYFWLASTFGALPGRVTEGAARLPSALAGIGLVWLTLRMGHFLFGGLAGAVGAGLLLTTFRFARTARRAQLDVLLALLETAALLFFWRFDRGLGSRRLNLACLHGAMGLAVLTKGPVGFLVPLLVIVAYLAWERRLGHLRRVLSPWALLLSLGPGVAWLAAAAGLAPAGYLQEAVGENVLGRFFQGTSHARPFYYYLYQFPVEGLPWLVLWPVVLWAARRRVFTPAETSHGAAPASHAAPPPNAVAGDAGPPRAGISELRRSWRFLLAWVGATLLFFSLSGGKRGLYMVPAFPAVALLCADAVLRTLAGRRQIPRALAVGAALGAGLLALLGCAAIAATFWKPIGVTPSHLFAFGATTVVLVAVGFAAWRACTHRRAPLPAYVGVSLAVVFGVEVAIFQLLFPGMNPDKSPRYIAEAAGALTPPDGRIGLMSDRALVGGLAYYRERWVALLSTPSSVRQFVEGGGQAIVVKARKLTRVSDAAPIEVRAEFREGRRTVLVVSPRRSVVSAPPRAATDRSRRPLAEARPGPHERDP
jgi:4-amino-4-deoxy-L-arabinose transferase-like glycosyltransferase